MSPDPATDSVQVVFNIHIQSNWAKDSLLAHYYLYNPGPSA